MINTIPEHKNFGSKGQIRKTQKKDLKLKIHLLISYPHCASNSMCARNMAKNPPRYKCCRKN